MTDIDRAISILRAGGLVAFPTETVYGLGADATNTEAVRRIFTVKGRPPTNPTIVHVAEASIAQRYARDWPLTASRLSGAFWPGPLTLVLPKSDEIVPEVSAGLATVGLRVPNHPLALELLRAFDGPIAAPSANRSTHVSPTTADHVRAEFGTQVDLILDGGPCVVGIESTVLDLTRDRPTILRPGGISREQIENIIGPVDVSSRTMDPAIPAPSPGQQEVHYAPRTPAYRFESSQRTAVPLNASPKGIVRVTDAPADYARELYATLRHLDTLNLPAIYVEMPPDTPEWLAVRDRLRRATRPLA